jgi:transcriptional regulator with XRE-family HTH domain
MDDDSKLALQLLAEKIKKRRKTLGLSQEKLAEKCGFDRTYISLLERSERNPSYLNLKKLSDGLGISLSELLNEL